MYIQKGRPREDEKIMTDMRMQSSHSFLSEVVPL